MPYIKPKRRSEFDSDLEELMEKVENKGELNYCIYRLGLGLIRRKGRNYQNISDAIAAMTDCADEMRRRILHPYEDEKIKENGGIDL